MKRIVSLILPILLLLFLAGCGSKQSLLTNGEATKHVSITYDVHAEEGSIAILNQSISGSSYSSTTEQDSDGSLELPIGELTGALKELGSFKGIKDKINLDDLLKPEEPSVEEPVIDPEPGGENPVIDNPVDHGTDDGDTDSGKPNPPNNDGMLGGEIYKVNLEFRGNRPEFKKDGGFTNPSRPTFYSWDDSHAKYMVGGAEVTAVFPCGYKTTVTLLHRDAYGVVGWPNHKTGNRHFTMRMSETKGRGIAVLIPAEKWSLEKLKQGGTLYIKMPKR